MRCKPGPYSSAAVAPTLLPLAPCAHVPVRPTAKVRRFETPEEYPFTPIEQLPKPILPPLTYPEVLFQPAVVNANSRIWTWYRDDVVPAITRRYGEQADDGQYGSAATRDVEVLSALSRRIHFGACNRWLGVERELLTDANVCLSRIAC